MVQRRNRKMQIFVDADACPVVAIIEKIAKDNSVPVMLLCDTNHVLSSTYSKVVVVGAGADAVDYKLISICHKGDIVVSQDYGVAAMALGKGAYAIHQSGKWYTNDNIDQMLMERHLSKKARRSSRKCHVKRFTTNSLRRRQERNCKKLNTYQKSPHKSRKTYGSILRDNKIDDNLVIQQMGHVDISTTEEYYHRNMKSVERKAEILNEIPIFEAKLC